MLTNKQRRFIDFYLQCWNATEAARLAGYSGDRPQLGAIGSANLKKPAIAEAINHALLESSMSANEVLKRLAEQARFSVAEFLMIDPETERPIIDWRKVRENGGLIKSIKFTRHGPHIELYDGQRALELIGKTWALFQERIDVTTQGEKVNVVLYLPDNRREQPEQREKDADKDG